MELSGPTGRETQILCQRNFPESLCMHILGVVERREGHKLGAGSVRTLARVCVCVCVRGQAPVQATRPTSCRRQVTGACFQSIVLNVSTDAGSPLQATSLSEDGGRAYAGQRAAWEREITRRSNTGASKELKRRLGRLTFAATGVCLTSSTRLTSAERACWSASMGAAGPLPPTKLMTAFPSLVHHLDHVTPASQFGETAQGIHFGRNCCSVNIFKGEGVACCHFKLMNTERRRNEWTGETGDPRENPPTNGIGIEPGSPWREASVLISEPPCLPPPPHCKLRVKEAIQRCSTKWLQSTHAGDNEELLCVIVAWSLGSVIDRPAVYSHSIKSDAKVTFPRYKGESTGIKDIGEGGRDREVVDTVAKGRCVNRRRSYLDGGLRAAIGGKCLTLGRHKLLTKHCDIQPTLTNLAMVGGRGGLTSAITPRGRPQRRPFCAGASAPRVPSYHFSYMLDSEVIRDGASCTGNRDRRRSGKESAMAFVTDLTERSIRLAGTGNRTRVLPNASPASNRCAASLGRGRPFIGRVFEAPEEKKSSIREQPVGVPTWRPRAAGRGLPITDTVTPTAARTFKSAFAFNNGGRDWLAAGQSPPLAPSQGNARPGERPWPGGGTEKKKRDKRKWLGHSPPTTAIWVRSPVGSLPNFHMWESCLKAVFLGVLQFPPPLHPRVSFHVMFGDDRHLRVPVGKPVTYRVLPRPGFTPHSSFTPTLNEPLGHFTSVYFAILCVWVPFPFRSSLIPAADLRKATKHYADLQSCSFPAYLGLFCVRGREAWIATRATLPRSSSAPSPLSAKISTSRTVFPPCCMYEPMSGNVPLPCYNHFKSGVSLVHFRFNSIGLSLAGSNEGYGVRDPVETQEDLLARVMIAAQQTDGTPSVMESSTQIHLQVLDVRKGNFPFPSILYTQVRETPAVNFPTEAMAHLDVRGSIALITLALLGLKRWK
ncbi:hypothetical protein PR048_030532 [Dryococelus australis]|uniref:Uncharacterized protein n=1 Tax=Dryococelus australis TaxID=614101 RepID=A0ABQ9G9A1_9NEOP|nr:hypothetical protein PR048_030532 [Dryococelus australis]